MIKQFLLATLCTMSMAYANVIIVGTRVIYPSNEKIITVDLNNLDDTPSLVQAWIEDSKENNAQKVPFVITPMVGRVEAKSRQSLRIRQVGADLPKDRESLFYLNVLDIPAKSKDVGDNYLQVTLRNKLKFFYRPAKLPYPVTDAYDKVTWHYKDKVLTVNNPTPYYITYAGVTLKNGERIVYETSDIDMVAPFDVLMINAPIDEVPNGINWYVINDYGATHAGKSMVQQ